MGVHSRHRRDSSAGVFWEIDMSRMPMGRIVVGVGLAVLVVVAPSRADDETVLVEFGASGWRHLIGPQGFEAGFESPDYDVSEWPIGSAPFGTVISCTQWQAATPWPLFTDLLLVRDLPVPGDAAVRVEISIDNDVTVHLDGVLAGPTAVFEGCAVEGEYVVTIPAASDRPTVRRLAIRARDRGGESLADVRCVAVVPSCVADVDADGAVGESDLDAVLQGWGDAGIGMAGDVDFDGRVDGADLARVLGEWGGCR